MSIKSFLYLLLLTGLCIPKIGFAQSNAGEKLTGNRVDITRVEIKDTVLIKYLEQFIKKQLHEDSLFRKRGYIQVFSTHAGRNPNVVRSYHINKNYISFDNMDNDRQFPIFYSFLLNRMIVFINYDLMDIFNIEFTKKSKVKFRKDIEPYLFDSKTILFPDEKNKKHKVKNFRPGEVFHFGGGMNVYIMNDGKVWSINNQH